MPFFCDLHQTINICFSKWIASQQPPKGHWQTDQHPSLLNHFFGVDGTSGGMPAVAVSVQVPERSVIG